MFDEIRDGLCEVIPGCEIIGLQELAWQDTKSDFDLVKPGSVGRESDDFNGERPGIGLNLGIQPGL